MLGFLLKIAILFFLITIVFRLGKFFGKVEKKKESINRRRTEDIEEADYEDID